MGALPPEPIPTGFAALDAALDGGLPRGRIVELAGPSSAGKTSLALQIAGFAQSGDASVAWIDADRGFDARYAAALGVVTEKLTVARPANAEQALEMAKTLARYGAIDLLIVDSAAALVPAMELVADLGHGGPGLQARVLASGLRRLAAELRKSGMCALFLNQIRMGGSNDPENETTAGGPPLRLFAAIRLGLRPLRDGSRVEFRLVKNRRSFTATKCELAWREGPGFLKTP